MKQREYNRNYYRKHKEEIMERRKIKAIEFLEEKGIPVTDLTIKRAMNRRGSTKSLANFMDEYLTNSNDEYWYTTNKKEW